MSAELLRFLAHVAGMITLVAALVAAAHAVLYRRDPRSAIGWVGIILLFPLAGPLIYALLGVNRIQRRAAKIRVRAPSHEHPRHAYAHSLRQVESALPAHSRHLVTLVRAVNRITTRPLLRGDRVTPLCNGDEAYPAMLKAIQNA